MLRTLAARLPARMAALSGWRRLGAAAVAGAVAVAALPPVHALPALWLAFPALLWLLDGAATRRAAFAIGWAFGMGFFVAGLYWIGNALLIDAARFGWMVPFAIGGLSAALAVYAGLATLAVHVLAPARGWGRVLVLAAAWTLLEMLRGWALTGFPWNPLGSVWMPLVPVIQGVAWIGTYGLSLLTVAAAAMPAVLAWQQSWGQSLRAPAAALAAPLAAPLVALALLALLGAARLPDGPTAVVDGVWLRLVQPNIPQRLKWDTDHRIDNLNRHIEMSRAPAAGGRAPTHVLWGETAVPFALDGNDGHIRAAVARALDGGGQAVLTGAVRMTPRGVEPYQVWNSLVAIDAAGALRGSFDKAHLVPFGEYVPLRGVLPLQKITAGSTDFSAGPGPRTVALPGLPPVGPMICYEIIFPGQVVDRNDRPQWMLNVTNDGWYGVSTGPYQHLATSRLRAVEEGLPLVRVANTGVSAIVDAHGRIVASIGLDRAGIADGPLPAALPPTLYARAGNLLPLALALAVGAIGLAAGRRKSFAVV
ncbi:apolipoprotein N-acyltransferase [Novispirillum sp. DQ9]|uniref:apolipoprotein N-acyltransferase n=1 Tax=Novispirillum sp. DQ9 TaxID=3398612 RepID=UPI003C7DAC9A